MGFLKFLVFLSIRAFLVFGFIALIGIGLYWGLSAIFL